MKYAPRKVYIKENNVYVELSYKDFCRRRQAVQRYMDKLFIPVQGCLLEVMREQYTNFYRDKERWRYLKKLDTNHSLTYTAGVGWHEKESKAETQVHGALKAACYDAYHAARPSLDELQQYKDEYRSLIEELKQAKGMYADKLKTFDKIEKEYRKELDRIAGEKKKKDKK